MSLSCTITIKGDGKGRHGHPAHDVTKPVSELLVNNVVYYNKVLAHLRLCTKCDPVEALRVYLNQRRDVPKFNGVTSSTLVKLARSYEKLFIKRGLFAKDPTLPALIVEFMWRSATPQVLIREFNRFTLPQCVEAIRLLFKAYDTVHNLYSKKIISVNETYRAIWSIIEQSPDITFSSPQEIREMIGLASVMSS